MGVSIVFELAAAVAIVAGLYLVSLPLALIIGGLLVLVLAQGMERK